MSTSCGHSERPFAHGHGRGGHRPSSDWLVQEIAKMGLALARGFHASTPASASFKSRDELQLVHNCLAHLLHQHGLDPNPIEPNVMEGTKFLVNRSTHHYVDRGYLSLDCVTLADFVALDNHRRMTFMKVCPDGMDCVAIGCVRLHGLWDPEQEVRFAKVNGNAKPDQILQGYLGCRDQLLDGVCRQIECRFRHFVFLREPLNVFNCMSLLFSYWNSPRRINSRLVVGAPNPTVDTNEIPPTPHATHSPAHRAFNHIEQLSCPIAEEALAHPQPPAPVDDQKSHIAAGRLTNDSCVHVPLPLGSGSGDVIAGGVERNPARQRPIGRRSAFKTGSPDFSLTSTAVPSATHAKEPTQNGYWESDAKKDGPAELPGKTDGQGTSGFQFIGPPATSRCGGLGAKPMEEGGAESVGRDFRGRPFATKVFYSTEPQSPIIHAFMPALSTHGEGTPAEARPAPEKKSPFAPRAILSRHKTPVSAASPAIPPNHSI